MSKDGVKRFKGTARLKESQSLAYYLFGSVLARTYPTGFGENLAKAMMTWRPQPTLRQKACLDLARSDRELFEEMETGDVWADAELHKVYWYLRTCKHMEIPSSWGPAFSKFDDELLSLGLGPA